MESQIEQDRYVIQLKEVFNSCDVTGCGNLDKSGLVRLCQRLQLEEQSSFLINRLLKNNTSGLVNFDEFKDCFVALLAQSTFIDEPDSNDALEVTSPEEREVSPKYVYGTKKYGRRSRPESDEINDSENDLPSDYYSDLEVFLNDSTSKTAVDGKMVSLAEKNFVIGHNNPQSLLRKRRRTSLDDKQSVIENCNILNLENESKSSTPDENTESKYLQTIWKKMAVGENGFLDLEELERVCQHIGMENVSREVVSQLFAKLDLDQDGKISFQEFLHLFENGEANTGSSQSSSNNSTPQHVASGWKHTLKTKEECCEARVDSISESGMFSTIDPENNGFVTPESIAEFWDSLGFPNGIQILKDLGFHSTLRISLLDLSSSLEDCLMSSEEGFLHQVAIVTVQHEFKHNKLELDQVKRERDKLKTDVAEANLRAAMLAQEVDDQNAKLEKSSQNKIIGMERKYKEQVQLLQEELRVEKEQLTAHVTKVQQNLQDELFHLQQENISFKDQVINFQAENDRLDHEVKELTDKLIEYQKLNQQHVKELESLTVVRQRLEALESGQAFLQEQEHEKLLIELQSLKLENQSLRDQNDELALQVESLRQQVSSRLSAKAISHKRNGSSLGDYIRPAAVKRRGDERDSPTDDDDISYAINLRLGKVHCKNQESDSLEKDEGQDSWQDDSCLEDGECWENNETCVDSSDTRKSKENNVVPMSTTGEMKQVFIYLRNRIAEEQSNEINSKQMSNEFQERLEEAEWERDNLSYQLQDLKRKHEEELGNLQIMFDEKCKNILTAETETKDLLETATQTEIRGTVDSCQRLRARLDVAMTELEMALVREAQGDELLYDFEQKYLHLREKLTCELQSCQRHDYAAGDSGSSNLKLPVDKNPKIHLSGNFVQLIIEEILRPTENMEANESINKELVMILLNFLFRTRELVKLVHGQEYFCGTESASRSNYLLAVDLNCKNLQKCLSELHSKEIDTTKHPNKLTEIELKCCALEEKLEEKTKCLFMVENEASKWKEEFENLSLQFEVESCKWKEKIAYLEAQQKENSVYLTSVEDRSNTGKIISSEKEIQTEAFEDSIESLKTKRTQLNEECQQLQNLRCSLQKEFSDLSKDLESSLDSSLFVPDQEVYCSDLSSTSMQTQSTDLDRVSEQNLPTSDISAEDLTCKTHECSNSVIGIDLIHNLNQRLKQLERRCHFLEESAKAQTQKAAHMLNVTNQQHRKDLSKLKELLSNTQSMLKQQAVDYENQLEVSDCLVKNLYVENGQLMKALQVTEERQKKAEQLNVHLHEKCKALTELVANIYKTAIS